MVAEADTHIEVTGHKETGTREDRETTGHRLKKKIPIFGFSSLTRRIVVLNLAGLVLFPVFFISISFAQA